MSYVEFISQDRRLVILRILRDLPERRANQYALRRALEHEGYTEIVPTVHNDLLFLAKEGLVITEKLPADVLLATITDLGDLVARGLTRVQGVAVPAV